MKEVAVGKKTFSFIPIIPVIGLIVQLTFVDEPEDFLFTAGIFLFLVLAILHFLKTKKLSFDADFIYLANFQKIESIPFEKVIRISRNPFLYQKITTTYHYGYVIRYLDENDVRQKAFFYVSQPDIISWELLKDKIVAANYPIVIEE